MKKFKKRLLDYLRFGGVTKDQFSAASTHMRAGNIKTWKFATIFLTFLSLGMLLASFFVTELNGFIIPYSIVTGATLASCFCFLFLVDEHTKLTDILIYATILVYFGAYIYTSVFETQNNSIPTLAVLFVITGFLIVDQPWKMMSVHIAALITYIALEVSFKSNASGITLNIIDMGVYTLLGLVITLGSRAIRVPIFVKRVEIEKERDIDTMTGVYNSIAYERAVRKANIAIGTDDDVRLAIAVFDVNYLKKTNDSLGHLDGNKLIIHSVNLIKSALSNSKIYRIGGDEFVVFIGEKDFENKDTILSNLHTELNELNSRYEGRSDDISLAFGVAVYDKNIDHDYVSLFGRADAEMYENKKFLKRRLEERTK